MRKFKTFADLIEFRKTCPICSGNMTFEVTTSTFHGDRDSMLTKLKKHFDSVLNETKPEHKISISFKPIETDIVDIKELYITLKPNLGVVLANGIESALNLFDLKIYCPHEIIGNEYEAKASFDFGLDFADESLIPKDGHNYVLDIDNIKMDYEIFKICNVHLEDDKPNGNFIKILHDYHNRKTSFSIAEMNLDGTCGTWKEKRIDLVNDNFFKFADSEKIYSRVNAIFLLQ